MTQAIMEATKQEGFITFGDWSSLKEKLEEAKKERFEREADFVNFLGLDIEFYQKVINFAVRGWKESTSKSLFQAIGKYGLSFPIEGEDVFDSHLDQTRFFHLLDTANIVSTFMFGHVKDEEGNKIRLQGNTVALTYPQNEERREKIAKKVNSVLQMIYIYAYYSKKKVKEQNLTLSKRIYRGIRIRDLYNIPELKKVLSQFKYDPSTRNEYYKNRMNAIIEYIKQNGVNGVSENKLMSFTSSKAIAKYFANKAGIIVEINTKDAEIITSEVHDIRFATPDWVSNKLEREYIVRVADTKIEVTNIEIYDLDYFVAMNNPLAVNLFDHDDKVAFYELNGVRLKAQYHWSSNTKGSISYYNLDDKGWGYGSREFQKEYGFSPVISNKNLNEVQNFRIVQK